MRGLLSYARTNENLPMFQISHEQKRIEVSKQTNCLYKGHQKVCNGIIFNKNTRCFASYSERGIIVWNPENNETLF